MVDLGQDGGGDRGRDERGDDQDAEVVEPHRRAPSLLAHWAACSGLEAQGRPAAGRVPPCRASAQVVRRVCMYLQGLSWAASRGAAFSLPKRSYGLNVVEH